MIPLASFAQVEEGSVLGERTVKTDVFRFGSEVSVDKEISRDIIAGAGTIIINEPVAKDALLMGGTITVNAPVTEDLRVFGGNIIIFDEVGGDILAAGGTIQISGPILGDIRIAGGDIIISSTVSGNVAITGGKVVFSEDSVVKGSIAASGGEIKVNGIVQGNFKSQSGNIFINNEILGDVDVTVADSSNLKLGDNASIAGSLTYYAPSLNSSLDESKVNGEVAFYQKEAQQKNQLDTFIWFFKLIGLFGMLVAGLILVGVAPKSIRDTVQASIKNPIKDLLWGLAVLVATPVIIIFLMLTIIGFPLALILAAMYAISLYIAKVFVGIVLGTYIFGAFKGRDATSKASLLGIMVVGVAVLWLVSGIPVIGWFIQLIAIIWGLGLMIKIKKRSIQRMEKEKFFTSIRKDN